MGDIGSAFEVIGKCVRCQAIDIDPDQLHGQGPSLLAALATAEGGGSTSKGPTFGVLLRKLPGQELRILEVNMSLHVGSDGCS